MAVVDLSTVTKDDFDKHLNTEFAMHVEEQDPVKMELIETQDKSNNSIDGFSLAFVGKFENVFPQKIYKLVHNEMGEMELFLVPFNKDEKGVYYQAIFSRLKK